MHLKNKILQDRHSVQETKVKLNLKLLLTVKVLRIIQIIKFSKVNTHQAEKGDLLITVLNQRMK